RKPRRGYRVLVVVATRALRQPALAVGEHAAVLAMREWSALEDALDHRTRLGRQEGRQCGCLSPGAGRRRSFRLRGRGASGGGGRWTRALQPGQADQQQGGDQQRQAARKRGAVACRHALQYATRQSRISAPPARAVSTGFTIAARTPPFPPGGTPHCRPWTLVAR